MKQRLLTAFIMLAIAVPVVFIGGLVFEVVLLGLTVIGFFEIMTMARIRIISPEAIMGGIATVGLALPEHYNLKPLTPLLLLSVCALLMLMITVFSENKFSFERVGVVCVAVLYVGLGGRHIMTIRSQGFLEIVFVLGAGFLTDAGAYFVGRAIGKHQLAPHISPKKSIEGAVGGTLIACVAAMVFSILYQPFGLHMWASMLLGLCISVASQFGDLVASALKRFYGVKDSGNIFPGHGGVLDRFDGTIFGATMCQLILLFFVS